MEDGNIQIESGNPRNLLAPTAPHISEALWNQMGNDFSVHKQKWPAYDKNLLKEDQVNVVIQVNGRVRGKMILADDASEMEALKAARKVSGIHIYIDSQNITRVVYVPGKILNIVTED